ncbi:L,D-transpeptidase [Chamaesiphon sp.]|uniref:L,D-transpeptidase n=1 Tax=Chamaesiphon sp. TaxID=2814140 RepID=UPI00359453A6
MSRFSTSLILSTGLLLTTLLASIPTKLCAATAPGHSGDRSQTSVALEPPTKSEPVQKSSDPQSPTPPKLDAPASPPSGTSTSIPSKSSGTTSPVPAAAPAAKPAVAATSQPPVENIVNLVLKLKEKRVYVYKGEKLLKRYPVAIGKRGWETPIGEWQVMEKIRNPAWTSFKTGEVFPAGVKNPLGSRWIGFWTDGRDVIGFHGTPNIKSIGTAASHGCVRMLNRDVKALFPLVKVGTTVKVVNE